MRKQTRGEREEGRRGGGPIIGQFWSTPIKPCGPSVVGQKGSIRLRERGGGRGDVKKVVI